MQPKKELVLKIVKIAVGAFLGIMIASIFRLQNIMTAGIITILSLQSTKKETLTLAAKRLGSLVVALLLAFLSFSIFGFTIVAFGVFLLFFSGICLYTELEESISICAVLISQLVVAQSMEIALVVNQLLIFAIGAGIGILLNLFMNINPEEVEKTQKEIDQHFRKLLLEISKLLVHEAKPEEVDKQLQELKDFTDAAVLHAERTKDNYLLRDYSYYPKYLTFRRNQMTALQELAQYQHKPNKVSNEERMMSIFVKDIASVFHECNDASSLLERAAELLERFRLRELPQTREEFESRAILYGQLRDLVILLKLKRNFLKSLTAIQLKQYWKKCEISNATKDLQQ